jgi:Uma2 family endonuclease
MSTTSDFASDLSPRAWRHFLVDVMPPQGAWSEEQYLAFTDHTNRLIEFTDGCVEPLPMPTERHQNILEFLYEAFVGFIRPRGGKVHLAALRLRIRSRKFREPDLLLLVSARDPRRQNRFWTGADLVLEVVSPDKPHRDLVEKRGDYAEGGVPEYWIVNPEDETVTVLRLEGAAYAETGMFRRGQLAVSATLSGFAVEVNAVFDAD